MSRTNSVAFPNIFDVARNQFAVAEDDASIVNRSRLLILTEPTELYKEPNFGVGLKRYLWQYNTDNQKAIIVDRIKEQLALHEPCAQAEKTQYAPGLLFTDDVTERNLVQDSNRLKMTVSIATIYGDTAEIKFDNQEVSSNGRQ